MEYRRQRIHPNKFHSKGKSKNYSRYESTHTDMNTNFVFRKFVIALFIFLSIFIIDSIDRPISNKIIDGVRVAIDQEFDIKESLGRIKFVQKYFPKIKAVFGFNTSIDKDDETLCPFIVPAKGRIIASFGETGGINIEGDGELDVLCAANGEVILVDSHAQGYAITIRHSESLITVYHNITQPYVEKGEKIQQGTVIGRIVSVEDEKPVLHFKVWKNDEPVDPFSLFSQLE
ncbi:MAG TPA: M23 family metallopeptidase [Clostridiales bacterium]|nr:M23 family metallopeptidase [Clostridiales bacterium]